MTKHEPLFEQPPALPETGYLRLSEVLRIIPVSKSKWYAGIREGRYPQSYNLGGRIAAWDVADIRACMTGFQRNAARR